MNSIDRQGRSGLIERAYLLIERRGYAELKLADEGATVRVVSLFSQAGRCEGEIAGEGGTVNFSEEALLAVS